MARVVTITRTFMTTFGLMCWGLWLALVAAGPCVAAPDAGPRNVLFLFSNEAELPANQLFLSGVQTALAEDSSNRSVTYTEFLDLVRFPARDHQDLLADLIKRKYANTHFDVAIVAAATALDFASTYRDKILPGVPIVFGAVSRDDLRTRELPPDTTGIISRWDIARTLELAIGLQPRASQIVFITGASNFDRLWEAEGRDKLRSYQGRYTVTYLTGLPLAEVIDRAGNLDEDTIIIAPVFLEGGDGQRYIARDALAQVVQAAKAPAYAAYDTGIGVGYVGGYMDTFEEEGRQAGRLALRVIGGEAARSIAPYEGETHRYIVDWRALKRWNLSEVALPPGTEVRFKQPSAWEQYKFEIILILVALALQSLAILMLFLEGRRRRAAEHDARESKERMDLAISEVDLGLWDWDMKTGKIWATSSCQRIFGLDADRPLTRQSLADTILPEDRARVRSDIDSAIAERRPFETEYRVTLPNGNTRWITTKGSPRGEKVGEASRMVGVVIDVTQRKDAELEAEQQRQELAHLMRVSMLGALSGALAHELNQPLAAILTNAQAASRILSQEPVDMEEIRQILEDIMHDDRRAGDVIKHLRALLKKGESQMQTISVNDIVSEVLTIAHSDLILKNVAISMHLGDRLPPIHANTIQIQQVLLNLVVNACEAMNARPDGDRLLVVQTGINGGGNVRISVSDTGEGISHEGPEKLFEPFYTTKTLGLGLGLPICRSIVAAHGGRMWAEALPSSGAVFHIELPIATGGHA